MHIGEDEGYLVTFIHDETATCGGTSLAVYDARTMSDMPVARVKLPQRVPYGFHCHHMNEENFKQHLQGLSSSTVGHVNICVQEPPE